MDFFFIPLSSGVKQIKSIRKSLQNQILRAREGERRKGGWETTDLQLGQNSRFFMRKFAFIIIFFSSKNRKYRSRAFFFF